MTVAKTPEIRFTKIKMVRTDSGRDRLHLEFEASRGADWDQLVLNSCEKPAPSFHAALQDLGQDIVDICELHPSDRDVIVMRGLSISYTDDSFGVVLTAQKDLRGSVSPLNLTTPYKVERHASQGGDARQLLSAETVRRVRVVMAQAMAFLNGQRAQVDMFAGDGQKVA